VKIAIFCHSLISDWNHGNAHFLRGICSELSGRGIEIVVYEPEDSWSYTNLLNEKVDDYFSSFQQAYPDLKSQRYQILNLEEMLEGVDLAVVHEWNSPALIRRLGAYRRRSSTSFHVLFHDTHHRAFTDPEVMAKLDLKAYDGVLAYGASLREVYLKEGWADRVWTWHEAADIRVFRPLKAEKIYDVVWVGNWGDDERSSEIREFLINPVSDLGLRGIIFGVRYPPFARKLLEQAGIVYGGWLPNFKVPAAFARSHLTVHIPRRPYVRALAGIPTIRPFEAMACGIPLVSAPWEDREGLFRSEKDFLMVTDGSQMRSMLGNLLSNLPLADALRQNGYETILRSHTCAHRVDELLRIFAEL
jgi:spore maturation protein CgeB